MSFYLEHLAQYGTWWEFNMFEDTDILHSIVFYFIAIWRHSLFYKLKICGDPASLLGPFFQQHLFPLCLCVTFW